MFLDGLTNTAENNALLSKLLLESCLHRHGVHDGVYCGSTQSQALLQRNAKLVECLLQLRVYLLVLRLLSQWVGIVRYLLIVDRWHMYMSPLWFPKCLPVMVGFQTKFEHPFGLSFLLRDKAHNILVESFLYDFSMHVGGKAILIFLVYHVLDNLILFFLFLSHCYSE